MSDLLRQIDSLRAFGHPSAVNIGESNSKPPWPAPPALNGIRQDILKRLDVLEMKQRRILQEWPDLKSAWNGSLLITQLPNEILFRIVVYFSEQLKGYIEDDDDFRELGLVKTELMKLTLVCRRWRDVVVATPALWRAIDVGETSGWMKLALARSGDATIDVSFPSKFSEDHASLLKPHCHRLRSLRLQCHSPYAIRIILNTLPALKTLEAHGNPVDMKKGFYTDLRIARERFPSLCVLQLVNNIIPVDPLLYSQLCKLSLKACRFKATINLEQFAQLLAAARCLEHLELDEFLQNLPNSGKACAPRAFPLPSSLLSLRLSNHNPILSARFLAWVLVPATTSISIKSHVGLFDGGWEEQDNTLRAAVPVRPSLEISLPGLTTVTRARLTLAWNDKIECFSTQTGRRPDGGEVLITEILIATSSPLQTEDGLADLLMLLDSAPLAHLELIGRGFGVRAETWARIFQTFPLLVSLHVSADGAVFDGLHEASLAGPTEGRVACQGLECIHINDEWNPLGRLNVVFKRLIRCLQWRADRGSRLKELRMKIGGELVEDIKTYLPSLEVLVAKVDLV